MKPRFLLSLIIAACLLPIGAEDRPESLFDSPVALFKECYVPVMEHNFGAVLCNTNRGFILRGAGTHERAEPSGPVPDEGLDLNVAVRDATEIPVFEDKTEKEGELTVRTVRFPAFPPGQKIEKAQGLSVTLTYGPNADKEALAAIGKCIDAIKKTTGQK
ncbi:MAG: hypothetical protein EOP83_10160 [Verrucomicrobiaceae bacterium]|nr:MAG: hypothetical protein EOP83_10160 [Verrucomicrobiaceae bacterium]